MCDGNLIFDELADMILYHISGRTNWLIRWSAYHTCAHFYWQLHAKHSPLWIKHWRQCSNENDGNGNRCLWMNDAWIYSHCDYLPRHSRQMGQLWNLLNLHREYLLCKNQRYLTQYIAVHLSVTYNITSTYV